MKKLKYIIVGIIVVIILLTIIMIIVNNNRPKIEEPIVSIGKTTNIEEDNKTIYWVMCNNIINDFLININNKERLDQSYSMLNLEYIQKNKIEKENISNSLKEFSEYSTYATKELYSKEILSAQASSHRIFYARGIIRQSNKTFNIYVEIRQDFTNSTFDIIFMNKEEFESIKTNESLQIDKFQIEKNLYNSIRKYNKITDNEICIAHIEDLKNILNNNTNEVYDLLDKDYREKRFGDVEKFKIYMEDRKQNSYIASFTEYLVNRYDGYVEYICKDKYGNVYIFTESKPMQYTLKLDSYTVETESFKKEYNNGNDETKVKMNIAKFVLMLNDKNYEAAYNLLDSNFKNSNFSTLDKFIKYVKNSTHRYNNMTYRDFSAYGNNYILKSELTDLTNGQYKDDTKGTSGAIRYEWNFIVQLKNEYDFVMSFSV